MSLFRAAATAGMYALWRLPEFNNEYSGKHTPPPPHACWPLSAQGGVHGWILDLHGCNTAVASIAFQVALQTRLHFYMSSQQEKKKQHSLDKNDDDTCGCFSDLVVVVGQGKHSLQETSTLVKFMTEFITQVLTDSKLMTSTTTEVSVLRVMEKNPGRLVVSGAAIERWVRFHCAK